MFCPIEGKRSEKGMNVPSEIQDCLKASDPLFSTHKVSYMENCQRCVMAYELRRRGYSVVAQPYIPGGADMLPYMDRRYGWPAVFEKQIITDAAPSRRRRRRKTSSGKCALMARAAGRS